MKNAMRNKRIWRKRKNRCLVPVGLVLVILLLSAACGVSSSPVSFTDTPVFRTVLPSDSRSFPPPEITPTAIAEPTETISRELTSYEKEALDYFTEVALTSEYGGESREGIVVRWERPIRIRVTGGYTPEDLQIVRDHVALLNSLEGVPRITLLTENEGAGSENVWIRFLTQQEMNDWNGVEEIAWGFVTIWWLPDYQIDRAEIGIVTDEQTQEQRHHAILEELTQFLGLMNDSPRYEDSIFQIAYSEVTCLSAMDRLLVELLYCPQLHSGMEGDAIYKGCEEWLRSRK